MHEKHNLSQHLKSFLSIVIVYEQQKRDLLYFKGTQHKRKELFVLTAGSWLDRSQIQCRYVNKTL